jgi:hypothetical protein
MQGIVFGCDAARDIGEPPIAPYLFDSERFFFENHRAYFFSAGAVGARGP